MQMTSLPKVACRLVVPLSAPVSRCLPLCLNTRKKPFLEGTHLDV